MSSDIQKLRQDLQEIKKIGSKLSETEKNFLIANTRFKNLQASVKRKYLEIYKCYTENDYTEVQVADKTGVSLSVVRNVITMFGERLTLFAKGVNVLAPMLDRIRIKKQKLQVDIDKLSFTITPGKKGETETETNNNSLNIKIAELRIKYIAEMRKLDEQEIRMRGLLESAVNINIDNSKKQDNTQNFNNYEKPKSNVVTGKVLEAEAKFVPELPN